MSMNTKTYEAKLLETLDKKELAAKLDRSCKAIIASRQVLAHILQAVVTEYKDCTIDEILPLIGKVDVDTVNVNCDEAPNNMSSRVESTGTEDSCATEGTRYYDMKFSAVTPDNKTIGLIINIEIQNDFNVSYPLIKRAIYYASRMISAQYGIVFENSEYGKIQKVYSIWICTTPDVKHKNTISRYEITRKNVLGNITDTEQDKQNYDLINVIAICLGESDTKECKGIIRFLDTLLVKTISSEEKKSILENEYHVPMSKELTEEVDNMCNVSDLYWNGGVAEGMAKGMAKGISEGKIKAKIQMIINLFNNNIPVDIIAKSAELSVAETEKIIRENSEK